MREIPIQVVPVTDTLIDRLLQLYKCDRARVSTQGLQQQTSLYFAKQGFLG